MTAPAAAAPCGNCDGTGFYLVAEPAGTDRLTGDALEGITPLVRQPCGLCDGTGSTETPAEAAARIAGGIPRVLPVPPKRPALFDGESDAVLLAVAGVLDALPDESRPSALMLVCDELERRHPQLTPLLDEWAEGPTPASYAATVAAGMAALRVVSDV